MSKKSTDSSAPDHFCYVEAVLILPLHTLISYFKIWITGSNVKTEKWCLIGEHIKDTKAEPQEGIFAIVQVRFSPLLYRRGDFLKCWISPQVYGSGEDLGHAEHLHRCLAAPGRNPMCLPQHSLLCTSLTDTNTLWKPHLWWICVSSTAWWVWFKPHRSVNQGKCHNPKAAPRFSAGLPNICTAVLHSAVLSLKSREDVSYTLS